MYKVALVFISLFLTSSVFADEYSYALNKAKQAFLIQSGLQKQIKLLQRYVNKQVMEAVESLELTQEVGIIGGSYKIYKAKRVSFKIDGKRFTLTPNSISVTLKF